MKTVSQNTFQSIWNKSQKNTYHGTNVVIQLTYLMHFLGSIYMAFTDVYRNFTSYSTN